MENPYTPIPNQNLQPLDATAAGASWQTPARRPGGLTAICIIAIILGSLGLLGSLTSLVRLIGMKGVNEAFISQRHENNEMSKEVREMFRAQERMQREMQQQIQAVENRYAKMNIGLAGLNLIFSGGLLAGGILVLRLVPKANTLLVAVFAVTIMFEIVVAVVGSSMRMEMAKIISASMTHMMQSAAKGGGAEQAVALGTTMGKVIGLLMVAMTVGWALVKVVFYGIGVAYLGRPKIQAMFRKPQPGEMPLS